MVEKAKKRLTPILLAIMIAALLAVSGLAAFTSDFFANASAKAEETVPADNTDSDENGEEPDGGEEQDEPTDSFSQDVQVSANPARSGVNSAGQQYWNFAYNGRVQSFILSAGKWKLEVWGAQGGNRCGNASSGTNLQGGYGGYAQGTVTVPAGQTKTIYIVIGGQGSTGRYNAVGGAGGGYEPGDPHNSDD